MRIIDADKMKEQIDKFIAKYGNDCLYPDGKELKKFVDEQPTVCDINQIIHQLEQDEEQYKMLYTENHQNCNFKISIEIVF